MPVRQRLLATTGIAAVLLSGCMRRPVVYPDPRADAGSIERDIDDCREQAESPALGIGANTVRETLIGAVVGAVGGVVGGAIWGNPGPGAASGAAGGAAATLVSLALRPHDPGPAYRATVERCLQGHGYAVAAWE